MRELYGEAGFFEESHRPPEGFARKEHQNDVIYRVCCRLMLVEKVCRNF